MKTTPTTTQEPMLTIESETLLGGGVVKLKPATMVTSTSVQTPLDILMGLMSRPDVDLDRMERFLAMHERWEANEALKAYNQAFASFKSEAVVIVKNITVNDGPLKGKKYADLFAAVDSAVPALSKYGLSHSWKLIKDEKDWIEVGCILKHSSGHFEMVTMGGPPDAGGAKNAIQARASSVSYLERYTFLAITGLASSDGDKDGRTAESLFGMTEDAFQGHMQAIHNSADLKMLQAAFTTAWNAAKKDQATQKAFIEAKDKRKAELAGGAK